MQWHAPFMVMIIDHQGVFARPGTSWIHMAFYLHRIDIGFNASYYSRAVYP